MRGAVLVAIAASIGNLLQGWDNATIAGAVLYIKRELELENDPTMEGLIVAMSLIGATVITTFSGAAADMVGRRPMLILSSVLYFLSGLIMLWSPNVYVLLLARLIDGFGVGLAVTLVSVYISETAPPEIRGSLNTLPQFTGSGGMFLSYSMIFGMSLRTEANWRLMLGFLSIPSLAYIALTVFFLPESPRWLVSKGRMVEAKKVLQRLRGREDCSGELALLIEGLEIGGETSIEQYLIGPAHELAGDEGPSMQKEKIRLLGFEEGVSLVARTVPGQSHLGSALVLSSRHGSMERRKIPLMDPVVILFGSVHEKVTDMGSMRSALFPNFGSMFSFPEHPTKNEQWEEESVQREGEDCASNGTGGDYDDNLEDPLLSRQTTTMEGKDMVSPHDIHEIVSSMRQQSSILLGNAEAASSVDIGGGWQLAWQLTGREDADGKEAGYKRIYLRQESVAASRRGSLVSLHGTDLHGQGELIRAAALVSQPALLSKELMGQHPVGPAMVHPSNTASKGVKWGDLFEPAVKHALFVGIGLQLLQQFSGINGVLYYTPQILEQAGVGVLLANFSISSESASILISAFTTLLMLPCIGVAMRLMDMAGRRFLLLATIPVLIASLVVLVVANLIDLGTMAHAVLSTISVIVYFCCFVMGFGPIPNILCSEIFPTRIRGLCIAICALAFWFGDIIVTYSLPVMLSTIGLAGVFGIYAAVCLVALVFVYLKVPETKGMPLEVIAEFFVVGSQKATRT